MFFLLSKILYFIITPVFWIVLLLVLALLLKKPNLRKRLLIACLAVSILFTNTYIFNIIVNAWEYPLISLKDSGQIYEYGIVLGGMASENIKTGKIKFSSSIDRLMQAIILYKQGNLKKIIFTGGSGLVFNQESKEAYTLQNICYKLGIPKQDIIIEPYSKNTHENAVNTKKIITEKNVKVLLITSAFHMRRSAACFKHEGYNFDAYPTDSLEEQNLGLDDYFLPKATPLLDWAYIIKELVGFMAYKFAGYI